MRTTARAVAVRALNAPEWERRDLATGLWPMISAPIERTAVLDDLAATRKWETVLAA